MDDDLPLPCCDYRDHGSGTCNCPGHERSELHWLGFVLDDQDPPSGGVLQLVGAPPRTPPGGISIHIDSPAVEESKARHPATIGQRSRESWHGNVFSIAREPFDADRTRAAAAAAI